MKDFLADCIFWCFIGFCGLVAGCFLCSPLKDVHTDESEYNDFKDEEQ